jgi:hypothetical protein
MSSTLEPPPPERRAPRPRRRRIAAVVAGAISVHALLVAVARAFPGTPAPVLAALLSALVLGAIGEWLVHRFLMHRPWRPRILRVIYDLHHRGHHYVHFTPARYVHDGPINYVPVWPPQPEVLCHTDGGRFLSMAAQFVFYGVVALVAVVLPTLLAARSLPYAAMFVLATAAELTLFVRLHDAVHYPGQSRLERLPGLSRVFERLDRHHYLHHIDPQANTNFLLPLGDWLFGTLRRRPTAWEAARFPSYEQARRTLIVDVPQRRAPAAGTPAASSSP